MAKRKIVCIDENKCNGCGACVLSCAEGAIQIVDGKAKLVSETYCDGLGACLGECPLDAITIEEREASEFDEIAAMNHVAGMQPKGPVHVCPGSRLMSFDQGGEQKKQTAENEPATPQHSALGHWPIQLTLVPPHAPFLKNADILFAADCVPFAYPDFHRDFLKDKALLIACPKLDNYQSHLHKLTQILGQAQPRSVNVIRMEVPCCGGLTHLVKEAAQNAGISVSVEETTIGIRGDVLDFQCAR